nr:pyrroline-5-carboxylate reductase [Quercus suber]
MAPSESVQPNERCDTSKTLTVLGCGALGTAILTGILASRQALQSGKQRQNGTGEDFDNFIACVRRDDAAHAIRQKLAAFDDRDRVDVLKSQNLEGVRQANVILLACQPHRYGAIFSEPGIREALQGKLIISVLAGVTAAQIQSSLSSSASKHYHVVRTMPNTACFVRDSTTVIEEPPVSFPRYLLRIVESIFYSVGKIFYVESSTFNACTAVCGSSPAMFAVVLDAMVDGAVAMGLNYKDALVMAACAMRGTANMVIDGRDPRTIRFEVASPAGSTMQGLLALESGNVRSTIAEAVMTATKGAQDLGTRNQEA